MSRGPFIGRERELAILDRGLAGARGGDGGVILIEGEPGMGKTALAHELVRRARRDDIVTCWGACLEGEGAPAYRPWTQILRALGVAPDTLLAPGVDNRFHLFDLTIDAVRTASDERAMLVVLDDLHWADVASVRLLQALAAVVPDTRLFVVGLYRGTELHPDSALEAVFRERGVSRLSLGGMAPDEMARLAAEMLQRPPDAALLAEVERRAEGNPLFVVELVRLAATPGAAPGALPAGVHGVIRRRLDRLPGPTRRLLRQASVLEREFSVARLAEIAGVAAPRVVDLLDAATAADIVVADEAGLLRFAHSLMREVAYGELPPAERQRLHQRAAETIGGVEHLVDAWAHHLRQAAALSGPTPALDATLLAARRAASQFAYEHAAFQYSQALALLDQLPHATRSGPEGQAGVRGTVSRRQVLLDLARCQFRAGAVADAWSSCRAAADLGRAAGDPATVGEAATIIRGLVNDPICDEIHALCREALPLLDRADPVLEARLLGQLAVTTNQWAGGIEPGLSQRALLAAEATGDPDALFLALQARHTDLLDFRYAPERLSIGERTVQLGHDTGRHECLAWGHEWRLDAFWQLSRRAQMDTELAALTGVVGHMKEPLSRWRLTMIQASLAMLEGRYDDATALADEALALGRRGGHHEAEFYHLVFWSHLAPLVGETDALTQVEAFVRRFTSEGPFLARFWHVTVLADLGRLDEASAMWVQVLPHLDAFPRHTPEWIINLTATADLCVLLDRPDVAAGVYANLLPFADRQAITGAHTPSRGPIALYLGRLARLLGDVPGANAHLATALKLAEEMGSQPYEAMSRVEIARLQLARRDAGDLVRAERHLETARRVATKLGMKPLETGASGLLAARRGGRATPLSPREEEVAGLIAKGLSNRQLANRLHLSERTIETHVRSIFNKLGFDSRARIASWFASLPPRD